MNNSLVQLVNDSFEPLPFFNDTANPHTGLDFIEGALLWLLALAVLIICLACLSWADRY